MNDDTPDDFEQLLKSLRQPERPRPVRDLMPGILERINRPEATVVPLRQWRAMIAAAVLLVLLNVAGLLYYTNLPAGSDQPYALVSDYSLYE